MHKCSHTANASNRSFGFGSFCIVPDLANRQIVLRRRPSGLVQPGDTELVTLPPPEPADGEALVRTTYVGLDASRATCRRCSWAKSSGLPASARSCRRAARATKSVT
jgi:hypothetical protein